jgi:hypothetical protein
MAQRTLRQLEGLLGITTIACQPRTADKHRSAGRLIEQPFGFIPSASPAAQLGKPGEHPANICWA